MASFALIICTYNGIDRLPPTVKAISNLRLDPNDSLELVIVDNNSKDNTLFSLPFLLKDLNPLWSVKIVTEENPGLMNARIRGIKEALSDILIFVDDDNQLDPSYLLAAKSAFSSSEVKIIGGIGRLPEGRDFPDWFLSFGLSSYAIGIPNDTSLISTVYGAGMAIERQAALYYVGRHASLLLAGRTGRSLSSGDDIELCIVAGNGRVGINRNMTFVHDIEDCRVNIPYFLQLRKKFAQADALLVFYKLARYPYRVALKVALVILFKNSAGIIRYFFKSNSLAGKIESIRYIYFVINFSRNFLHFKKYYSSARLNLGIK